MVVEVRLFATFRKGRFTEKQIELPEGSSLSDILQQLQIAPEQVGILLVNGRNAPVHHKLASTDVVSIFPALGGG